MVNYKIVSENLKSRLFQQKQVKVLFIYSFNFIKTKKEKIISIFFL